VPVWAITRWQREQQISETAGCGATTPPLQFFPADALRVAGNGIKGIDDSFDEDLVVIALAAKKYDSAVTFVNFAHNKSPRFVGPYFGESLNP
jgi:hypothetical protein